MHYDPYPLMLITRPLTVTFVHRWASAGPEAHRLHALAFSVSTTKVQKCL